MNRKYVLVALLAAAPAFANDVDPFGFEREHAAGTFTRAQVQQELEHARIAGQLPVAGEIGVRAVDTPARKPRAQVVAETLAARRLGLLEGRGELGPVVATPVQEHQIQLAGQRAIGLSAEK